MQSGAPARLAQIFFAMLPDSLLPKALETFATGHGISFNGFGCELPLDREENGEMRGYDVVFYARDEQVSATPAEFMVFVAEALEQFEKRLPDEAGKLQLLLAQIEQSITATR